MKGLSWKKSDNPLREQWYDGIWNRDFSPESLPEILIKLRGMSVFEKWLEFQVKYGEELQLCGINDHDLKYTIEGWLTRLQGFHFIEKPFNEFVENLRVERDFAPKELISCLQSWNVLAD